MSKIIIDVRDNIDPAAALLYVGNVISQGRISKDNTKYCWLTTFHDGVTVVVRDYRKSDCFVVYQSKKDQYIGQNI
jgi:hypothetical protein